MSTPPAAPGPRRSGGATMTDPPTGLPLTGLPLTGRSVLVHALTAAAPQRLTALADAGSHVHVLAGERSAAIDDLASRGLVTIVDGALAAAITQVDIVVRESALASTTPATVDTPDRLTPVMPARNAPTDAMPAEDALGHDASDHDAGRPGGGVTLVGGGPGAPGLLTVTGWQALQEADVVVTDRLAPLGLLDSLPSHVEVVHVGKIPRGEFTPQETINAVIVEHARAGRRVVRLKGGDNFVFGRGGEEWIACRDAGVPVQVVPGVTSSVAAPALAGIPVTHRDVTQGFVVVSAHVAPGDPRSTVDWAALAASGLTLVILMGVATFPAVAQTLVESGLDAATPAAAIADAGMQTQRSVRSTVSELASHMSESGISAPAVVVVGHVVDALGDESYSDDSRGDDSVGVAADAAPTMGHETGIDASANEDSAGASAERSATEPVGEASPSVARP